MIIKRRATIYTFFIFFLSVANAQQNNQIVVPNTAAASPADVISGSDIIDDDSTNNSAVQSNSRSSTPAVGLPIGSWSILQLNDTDKERVCKQQVGFCANECGSPDMTSINFCNQTTMAWGCNCRNKVPDNPPYQWPVTLAECTGKEQNCESGCHEQPVKDLCIEGCKKYFRCNRPGGPQSRLQTLHPDITPNYDTTTSKASSTCLLSFSFNVTCLLYLAVTIFMIYFVD